MAREARQARRPTLTVPARGAPLHPQVGTKERPPGTNKGTAQSQEAIDDVINAVGSKRDLERPELTFAFDALSAVHEDQADDAKDERHEGQRPHRVIGHTVLVCQYETGARHRERRESLRRASPTTARGPTVRSADTTVRVASLSSFNVACLGCIGRGPIIVHGRLPSLARPLARVWCRWAIPQSPAATYFPAT